MYRNAYAEINIDNLQNNVKQIIKKYPEYDYYFGVVREMHMDIVIKYVNI